MTRANQPIGNGVLGATLRPAEPQPADEPAIEQHGVGPAKLHLPLGRAMRRERVADRVHGGEMRAARRNERLVGLQHYGEFEKIVAPHPDERPCPRLGRDGASVREGVAALAQRHRREAGRQVERRGVKGGMSVRARAC